MEPVIFSVPKELVWYFVPRYQDAVRLLATCKRFYKIIHDDKKLDIMMAEMTARIKAKSVREAWEANRMLHRAKAMELSMRQCKVILMKLNGGHRISVINNSLTHKLLKRKGYKSSNLITLRFEFECECSDSSPSIELAMYACLSDTSSWNIPIHGRNYDPDHDSAMIGPLRDCLSTVYGMCSVFEKMEIDDIAHAEDDNYTSNISARVFWRTLQVAIISPNDEDLSNMINEYHTSITLYCMREKCKFDPTPHIVL